MLSRPASANSAGSLFTQGIVWLVNENLQLSVLFSLNLCRWVRQVRPSAFSMARSSGVTATSPWPHVPLYTLGWGVGHVVGPLMSATSIWPTVRLCWLAAADQRHTSTWWHGFPRIFSKPYLSLLVCGSHMVAAYSATDLTKLKHAIRFSCVGHFMRFLLINTRRPLHLFAVIVMWSEKCRD